MTLIADVLIVVFAVDAYIGAESGVVPHTFPDGLGNVAALELA